MTTPWDPADIWPGETVAVIAPSATQAMADSVSDLRRIVVRRAFTLAPDADMLAAVDAPNAVDPTFWDDSAGFAGVRVCGVPCDVDAMYVNVAHERVILSDRTLEIRNNGLFGIRLAALAGASKIVLVGFDAEAYEERESSISGFIGLTEGLAQLIAELRARGIVVEQIAADVGAPKPLVFGTDFDLES